MVDGQTAPPGEGGGGGGLYPSTITAPHSCPVRAEGSMERLSRVNARSVSSPSISVFLRRAKERRTMISSVSPVPPSPPPSLGGGHCLAPLMRTGCQIKNRNLS